jgi:hypothetical protein
MIMRATMLHLKASTTSKVGTKLGETHDDIHIVVGHIHLLVVIMGCGSTLSFVTRMYFLFVHLSIGSHLHTYLFGKPLTYVKGPMILLRWTSLLMRKTSNKTLYTQQGKKEGIAFTLKESTNGSSSLGEREGGG